MHTNDRATTKNLKQCALTKWLLIGSAFLLVVSAFLLMLKGIPLNEERVKVPFVVASGICWIMANNLEKRIRSHFL